MNNTIPTPRPKLLVVDDQDMNRRMVARILGGLGFDVLMAEGEDQALGLMEIHAFDLILLDVLMPGRDGFAVCQAIRDHPQWRDIPVIFLSAVDDKDIIVRALQAGGADYVTKPFNAAELVSRVRTHIALKTAREALQQVAEDKDELLGILAHDLKNHLGGMKISAQALQAQTADGEETVRSLAINIQKSTDQMFTFVGEFLANCAADQGFALKPEPIWLDELSAAATAHYVEIARRKRIQLTYDGKVSDPSAADASAVNQILHNLISNAVKFSSAGTVVSVRVETDVEGRAAFSVQDQGPGFTNDDKARMFRRYQRLSAQPTADEPSSGLGLSIARKLAHQLGGELLWESVAGRGSTFTLRLPAFTLESSDLDCVGARRGSARKVASDARSSFRG